MKRIAVLLLFSAGLQAQTNIPPGQLRQGAIVGVIACVPDTPTQKGSCVIAQLDPSLALDTSFNPPLLKSVITSNSPQYVSGPTGSLVIDNSKNPKQIDIATEVVPRKAQSEKITGLWSFTQGLALLPVPLPVCDTANQGRLLQDVADGALKFCNGEWQALTPHTHWQFRTSTAVLTIAQSTFSILDPTIVPDSLEVYRNGILMTMGPDYVRAGLGAQAPVQFTAAQAPQAGDTVTLKYMW